jgi:molybdopterin/thiamine biosynthesis adenylyltransferase
VWETLGFAALRACTCVVCAVDNFEARIRVNQLCRLARVDLVNAAIDSRYASVESYPFGSAQECACYECGLPPSVYQRIANRYSCGWLRRLGLVERKVPTTIITSAVSGALGASMALRLGEGEPKESATRYLLDTIGRQSTSSAIPKAPDCVGCGHIGRTTRIVPVTAGTESWLCAALPELAQATRIRVSDQIITGMRCTTCDPVERPVFARATDNDESLTVCERCGQRSVAVSIRDTFTAAELARLQGTLPVKYALVNVGATTLVMDCTRERKECE